MSWSSWITLRSHHLGTSTVDYPSATLLPWLGHAGFSFTQRLLRYFRESGLLQVPLVEGLLLHAVWLMQLIQVPSTGFMLLPASDSTHWCLQTKPAPVYLKVSPPVTLYTASSLLEPIFLQDIRKTYIKILFCPGTRVVGGKNSFELLVYSFRAVLTSLFNKGLPDGIHRCFWSSLRTCLVLSFSSSKFLMYLLLLFPLFISTASAKMACSRRARLVCCLGCGEAEHGCSCTAHNTRNHVGTPPCALPLSSASVSDKSATVRSCKSFHRRLTCEHGCITMQRLRFLLHSHV